MTQNRIVRDEGPRGDRLINPLHSLSRGENMITAECDEEGRLLLGPDLRHRYGGKFLVVEKPDELILRPVQKDPVKDLEEWGKPLRHLPLGQIKRIIDKRAMEEVGA